jgi:hypothetical protein
VHYSNGPDLHRQSGALQGQRLGWRQMSDYQQKIRDVIFQAVEREIAIYEAASIIEKIVRTEIDGE